MEKGSPTQAEQSSPPQEEQPLTSKSPEVPNLGEPGRTEAAGGREDGSGSKEGSGKGSPDGRSWERVSRSKVQYEPDPEDAELREKLQESRLARKKTEEDAKVLMNRLLMLKNEEQKVGRGRGRRLGGRLKRRRSGPRKSSARDNATPSSRRSARTYDGP